MGLICLIIKRGKYTLRKSFNDFLRGKKRKKNQPTGILHYRELSEKSPNYEPDSTLQGGEKKRNFFTGSCTKKGGGCINVEGDAGTKVREGERVRIMLGEKNGNVKLFNVSSKRRGRNGRNCGSCRGKHET